MTPQQLCASLENSKALAEVCKEKGIELPESLFNWYRYWKFPKVKKPSFDREEDWISVSDELYYSLQKRDSSGHSKLIAPAYTTGELGMMLPPCDYTKETQVEGTKNRHGQFLLSCRVADDVTKVFGLEAETEQDARILMLIYLIKNDLITNLSVKE